MAFLHFFRLRGPAGVRTHTTQTYTARSPTPPTSLPHAVPLCLSPLYYSLTHLCTKCVWNEQKSKQMSFILSLSTEGNKDLEYCLRGSIKMNQGQQVSTLI